ncbi:TenA family protein [Brachybacterium sp. DNPG3]
MSLFAQLRAAAVEDWDAYTRHEFVERLGEGTLPLAAFQDYLVQDYLFLVQFARAYALAAYKGRTLEDVRRASEGLTGVLVETDLHARLTTSWGISPEALAATQERMGTVAYTRFVLDCGASGDLLDLHVALAPCAIGYGEIGARLAPRLADRSGTQHPDGQHPYGDWIAEYAGEEFQASARAATARLDELAASAGSTDAAGLAGPSAARLPDGPRLAELTRIFRTATRLEAAFWQQALDAV